MISRRSFLTALAATGVAPFVPLPDPVPLKFHPQAFAFVMDPLTGISIRFIQQYDIEADRNPRRSDVWRHASACGGREQDDETKNDPRVGSRTCRWAWGSTAKKPPMGRVGR